MVWTINEENYHVYLGLDNIIGSSRHACSNYGALKHFMLQILRRFNGPWEQLWMTGKGNILPVSCVTQLFACISRWRVGFDPNPFYSTLLLYKVFLSALRFSFDNVIPYIVLAVFPFISYGCYITFNNWKRRQNTPEEP